MQIYIRKNYESLSNFAATEILNCVKYKPDAVLCFASGNSPQLTFQLLAQKAKVENVDFSQITFIGFDEWVGISPENEGSCGYFLKQNVVIPLGLSAVQVHLFDALANDLEAECEKMNQLIKAKGGIDLMVVGIGMNGHIGFNEPHIPIDNYAHVADLEPVTQSVGQKYFTESTVLKQGITLGLKHLLEANNVLLLANGAHKSAIVQKALQLDININLPATLIRQHAKSVVVLDEAAAALLHFSQV